jgi:hypothetical protein
VWQEVGVKPHRLERYLASNDPEFEEKAADIIGLYLNPPQYAVVFWVDEKTAIQALDQLDPVLPLSPGRAERHGFGYYRHGTLSLYAALDTQTGKLHGRTAARHTSVEFVDFLTQVAATRPPNKRSTSPWTISRHKTKLVHAFLDEHPNVHLHFTTTYSSWFNQVEIWFSLIERGYIRAYSAHAKPFPWKYSDPSRHIGNVLFAAGQ